MVWETKKKIVERGKHDGNILRLKIVGISPLILGFERMIAYYGQYTYWVPTYTYMKDKNI